MNLKEQILDLGCRAREAARCLARLTSEQKNVGLTLMAAAIEDSTKAILAANGQDIAQAKSNSLSTAMIERLARRATHQGDGHRDSAGSGVA